MSEAEERAKEGRTLSGFRFTEQMCPGHEKPRAFDISETDPHASASELGHLKEGSLTNHNLMSSQIKMGNIKICLVVDYARLVSVTHRSFPHRTSILFHNPEQFQPEHLQEWQWEKGILRPLGRINTNSTW